MKKFYLFTVLIFYFCAFHTVSAQLIPSGSISLNANPKYAEPNKPITLTLESFSTNLNQAIITWSINGVTQKKGQGLKTFSLTAGSLGSVETVTALIDSIDLGPITKKIQIIPGDIDFLEQSNSFVPPFYKGKGLTPTETETILVAKPYLFNTSGRKLNENEIVFTWKKGSNILQESSGVGRSTLNIISGRVSTETYNLELTATSVDGQVAIKKFYTLKPNNPELLFYEDSPLQGIGLQNFLGNNLNLTKQEFILVGYPFFFDKDLFYSSNTSASWSINGTTVDGTNNVKNILNIRKPDTTGVSTVSLNIENLTRVLSQVTNSLTISYEK